MQPKQLFFSIFFIHSKIWFVAHSEEPHRAVSMSLGVYRYWLFAQRVTFTSLMKLCRQVSRSRRSHSSVEVTLRYRKKNERSCVRMFWLSLSGRHTEGVFTGSTSAPSSSVCHLPLSPTPKSGLIGRKRRLPLLLYLLSVHPFSPWEE